MKLLCDRILKDGNLVSDDVLKVDSFLNHCLDISLLSELGKEFYRLYKDDGVTKILTIEASGIALACLTAQHEVITEAGEHSSYSGWIHTEMAKRKEAEDV